MLPAADAVSIYHNTLKKTKISGLQCSFSFSRHDRMTSRMSGLKLANDKYAWRGGTSSQSTSSEDLNIHGPVALTSHVLLLLRFSEVKDLLPHLQPP